MYGPFMSQRPIYWIGDTHLVAKSKGAAKSVIHQERHTPVLRHVDYTEQKEQPLIKTCRRGFHSGQLLAVAVVRAVVVVALERKALEAHKSRQG